jgi:hypothetical protein
MLISSRSSGLVEAKSLRAGIRIDYELHIIR